MDSLESKLPLIYPIITPLETSYESDVIMSFSEHCKKNNQPFTDLKTFEPLKKNALRPNKVLQELVELNLSAGRCGISQLDKYQDSLRSLMIHHQSKISKLSYYLDMHYDEVNYYIKEYNFKDITV